MTGQGQAGPILKPTDEMEQADDDAAWENPVELGGLEMANVRAGLAAVLAIVERDYSLRPAMCDQPNPAMDLAYCELPRGHDGKHSATVTRAVDW